MLDDTTKMGRFQGMLRAELNKVNDFACAFRLHFVQLLTFRPVVSPIHVWMFRYKGLSMLSCDDGLHR